MANKKYKLTDGNYWATDGVYDFDQGKTQREVNSDLSGAINGKQDAITIITKTPNNVSCASLALTTLDSLTLTAGTWVIICFHEWIENVNAGYIDNIIDATANTTLAASRNLTMSNGGGVTLSAFAVLTGSHTITYSTYNVDSSARTAKNIRLIAFKIA